MPRVGRRQSETEASNQRKARFKSNSTVHGMKDEMDFFVLWNSSTFFLTWCIKKVEISPSGATCSREP